MTQPYPWRWWLWQLNQHYLRLISHTLQLFWPIVFRGIKQNIIYIYPYENSNSSRAPSNIHRTFHNSESIVPDNASTRFISSIQLVSESLSLKFRFKIFEFYLVSHLSFRNHNLNSVVSFFSSSLFRDLTVFLRYCDNMK